MMAAKNPKRVAAGKKAWRNRTTTSKSRSYRGKGRSRKKPIQRGIGGRIGAFVLGVVPVATSGLDAGAFAMAVHKRQGLNPLSTVTVGFYRFINNLSVGFFNVEAYKKVAIYDKSGATIQMAPGAGIPGGAHWITSGVGLFMMLEDYIASKLAGGRPVKIIGTNYNAVGGS